MSLPALAVCVLRVAWVLALVTPIGLRRRPDAQWQRPTPKDSKEGEGLRGSEQPALQLQSGAPELRQRQHESPSCLQESHKRVATNCLYDRVVAILKISEGSDNVRILSRKDFFCLGV